MGFVHTYLILKMFFGFSLQENYRMGGSYKWPSVNEVMDYRRTVRNIIIKMIQDTPLVLPITKESPWVGL